jgi:hypothetical protein
MIIAACYCGMIRWTYQPFFKKTLCTNVCSARDTINPENSLARDHAGPVSNVCFSNRPLGSSAFRLSATTVSMSLAGSRFSSESAPGPLYGAFLVKRFKQGGASFSFVSFLVRSESPFLHPDAGFAHAGARGAVKGGRRINLAACSALARSHLDGFENDGTAWCGRDYCVTIRMRTRIASAISTSRCCTERKILH